MGEVQSKQNAAERLFTLTCCLMAAPVIGLSKKDLFAAVSAYANQDSEMAKEKMFDRDKTALRDMGVALDVIDASAFDEGESARYRISRGIFNWPEGFEITPEQLRLLELAAKAWNNQLLSKSAESGITRLRFLGAVSATKELSIFTPRLLAQHDSFGPLAEAIANSRQAVFEYRKSDSESSIRELTPLKLRFIEGQWVLLAKQGNEIKNFLLRRIVSKVKILDLAGLPVSEDEILDAEQDLVNYVEGNLAVLEIEPESEAWWHFGASNDAPVELHFMDEALLAEDLLEFGSEIKVLEPQSLARRISESLSKVVDAHA